MFAAQGARVVLGARSVQKLQLIAGDIRVPGAGRAAYWRRRRDRCRRVAANVIDTAVREVRGIDVRGLRRRLSMRAYFDDVDRGGAATA